MNELLNTLHKQQILIRVLAAVCVLVCLLVALEAIQVYHYEQTQRALWKAQTRYDGSVYDKLKGKS